MSRNAISIVSPFLQALNISSDELVEKRPAVDCIAQRLAIAAIIVTNNHIHGQASLPRKKNLTLREQHSTVEGQNANLSYHK